MRLVQLTQKFDINITGNVMFASGFDNVSEIVCSDFLETNRTYVKGLISGEARSKYIGFDWEKLTEWAYGNSSLVESFRKKCKKVAFVDMSEESGKGYEEIEESGTEFDLITSEWAFCEGTRDLVNYEEVIKKLDCLSLISYVFYIVSSGSF